VDAGQRGLPERAPPSKKPPAEAPGGFSFCRYCRPMVTF
jgi:hypothetical protein